MSTKIALSLALLIAGFFVLDHFVLQMNAGVFLGKKLIELVNYLAIWR
jgi:hypothetical protein